MLYTSHWENVGLVICDGQDQRDGQGFTENGCLRQIWPTNPKRHQKPFSAKKTHVAEAVCAMMWNNGQNPRKTANCEIDWRHPFTHTTSWLLFKFSSLTVRYTKLFHEGFLNWQEPKSTRWTNRMPFGSENSQANIIITVFNCGNWLHDFISVQRYVFICVHFLWSE